MSPVKYVSAIFNKSIKRKLEREAAVRASENPHAEMSLVSHVVELRKHIIMSLVYYAGFTIVAFIFMDPLIKFLRRPYELYQLGKGESGKLTSIGLFEVVMMNFKICLIVALVAAAPFMVRELWRFVSPALYEHEKKVAGPVTFASVFLFYAGVAFGFFVIVPVFLSNTLDWASEYATVMLTVDNYFSSLTTMVMIFGIIFEVPVVLSLLGLAGLITSDMVSKNRRIVILASFIIGALLSPPDVFSQTVVSVPLYLMCEISVFALRIIEKRRSAQEALEAEERAREDAEERAREEAAERARQETEDRAREQAEEKTASVEAVEAQESGQPKSSPQD